MSLSLTGESQMARREHGFCGYGGVGLAPRRGFGGHIGNGPGFGRHGGATGFPGVVSGRGLPVQGVFGGPHPCAMGPGPRNHHLRRGGIFGNRYIGAQSYGLPTGGVYNGNCPNANPGQLCLECGLIHYNSIESESRNKKSCCATKDIIVRGKTYSIRRSFLSDNTKFENELCKYVDKKKESELPEDVVQLLIDYINDDEYECNKLLDEVTLNILASQVGVKSIVEISLNNLKNWTLPVMEECFVQVTITVLFSKKVDTGLKQWLGNFLVERAVLQDLWVFFTRESPEVAARLEIMFAELSLDVSGFGLGYRIL